MDRIRAGTAILISIVAASASAQDFYDPEETDPAETAEEAMSYAGSFSRSAALYALAARSDSATVQGLIFQADVLDDPISRRASLQILFSRLVELDPESAIALSRTPPFGRDTRYEAEIWTAWGRINMDAALAAATELGGQADRIRAAQSLFSAVRPYEEAAVREITATLGVRPNRYNQTQFLVLIASDSPEEALGYINRMSGIMEQKYLLGTLGMYLGRLDPEAARGYASVLESAELRRHYLSEVSKSGASRDPRVAVERALQYPTKSLRLEGVVDAMKQFAQVDPRGAVQYLYSIENAEIRNAAAAAIISPIAVADPQFAMQFAREIDPGGRKGLYPNVLAQMAVKDPQTALSFALEIEDPQGRSLAVQRVLSVVGQLDPPRAVSLLDQIEGTAEADIAWQEVAVSYINADANAAVDWLLSEGGYKDKQRLQRISHVLIEADVHAAQRLLQALDGDAARLMRQRIASKLAEEYSAAETFEFISQFEDDEDFEQMQMLAIGQIAQTDIEGAINHAAALPSAESRDKALLTAVQFGAQRHPAEMIRVRGLIEGDDARSAAAMAIATHWYSTDPESAMNWARNLGDPKAYDTVLITALSGTESYGPAEEALFNEISDPDTRKQILRSMLGSIARNDPGAALRLIGSADLTPEEREQYEQRVEILRQQNQ